MAPFRGTWVSSTFPPLRWSSAHQGPLPHRTRRGPRARFSSSPCPMWDRGNLDVGQTFQPDILCHAERRQAKKPDLHRTTTSAAPLSQLLVHEPALFAAAT